MNDWIVYGIGFLAQTLFSARFIIQWLLSEKKKRIVTPSLFWYLGLGAALLLFVYGYLRSDFAIMLGQVITYFIYIRNLQLQGEWQKQTKLFQWFICIIPFVSWALIFIEGNVSWSELISSEEIPLWLLVLGIVSQILFTLRFVYQWIYSENRKHSHLPLGFWLMSLLGSSLILVYGIFRKDPVLIVAHLFGLILYLRSIYLLKNQKDD